MFNAAEILSAEDEALRDAAEKMIPFDRYEEKPRAR